MNQRLTVRILSSALILLAMLVATTVNAQSAAIKSYTARYNVKYKGLSGGDIEFTLKRDADGHYLYRSHLLPNFLGSFFISDQAEDTSEGTIDGVNVQPLRFRSEDGSSRTDEDISFDFDWMKNHVNGRYRNTDFSMDVPRGVQDRLSIQLTAMLALQAGHDPGKLVMLEKNELQEYTVLRQGNEQVRVAAGSYDTVVLESERIGSSRTTRYWYSDKSGYVMVRAERRTKGKPDIVMELKSIKFP